jgi:hypothetical protein
MAVSSGVFAGVVVACFVAGVLAFGLPYLALKYLRNDAAERVDAEAVKKPADPISQSKKRWASAMQTFLNEMEPEANQRQDQESLAIMARNLGESAGHLLDHLVWRNEDQLKSPFDPDTFRVVVGDSEDCERHILHPTGGAERAHALKSFIQRYMVSLIVPTGDESTTLLPPEMVRAWKVVRSKTAEGPFDEMTQQV